MVGGTVVAWVAPTAEWTVAAWAALWVVGWAAWTADEMADWLDSMA